MKGKKKQKFEDMQPAKKVNPVVQILMTVVALIYLFPLFVIVNYSF